MSAAAAFRALHRPGDPLVLVNAWDVVTAKIVAAAGYPAIATSSLALAGAAGYGDGQDIPFAEVLEMASRIERAVGKPVSVDAEAGFSDEPEGVRATVAALCQAGMAGMNLEDGIFGGKRRLVPFEIARAKVAAARSEADANGDLHLNARVDTFILAEDGDEPPVEETLKRAHAYVDAGADSIFIPLLGDLALIERFANEIAKPINILMLAGYPTVDELASAGAGRISLGSFPYRWFQGAFEAAVATFGKTGAPSAFVPAN